MLFHLFLEAARKHFFEIASAINDVDQYFCRCVYMQNLNCRQKYHIKITTHIRTYQNKFGNIGDRFPNWCAPTVFRHSWKNRVRFFFFEKYHSLLRFTGYVANFFLKFFLQYKPDFCEVLGMSLHMRYFEVRHHVVDILIGSPPAFFASWYSRRRCDHQEAVSTKTKK